MEQLRQHVGGVYALSVWFLALDHDPYIARPRCTYTAGRALVQGCTYTCVAQCTYGMSVPSQGMEQLRQHVGGVYALSVWFLALTADPYLARPRCTYAAGSGS